MRISKAENKSYNLNNTSYRNISSTIPITSINITANRNKTINFLGNDDSGISKAYASAQIDNTKQKATAIWNEIEKSNSIAILTHRIPDGDALGSGLAMLNTLREKFPNKQIDFITPGNFPKYLKGIPGTELIITNKNNIPTEKYDLAIAVDCDEGMMDGIDVYKASGSRINIDHHGTNMNLKNKNQYDDIPLVDGEAPSATEVIYNKLLKPLNVEIPPSAAECLLTGLLTDSGEFEFIKDPERLKVAHETNDELLKICSKTGEFTLENITSKLDENGKESEEIAKLSEHLMSEDVVKSIETKNGQKISYTIVDQDALKSFNVQDGELEIKQMVNKLSSALRETSGNGIAFWETGDQEIKISMRSNNIILNELAAKYGGGGHPNAAGLTLKGKKNQVINDFVEELKEYDFKEN